jgi:hypothetical protein
MPLLRHARTVTASTSRTRASSVAQRQRPITWAKFAGGTTQGASDACDAPSLPAVPVGLDGALGGGVFGLMAVRYKLARD